jgi:UDP-N-acetylglucosamine 2-epimerase (non-hydrolysing)
MIDTLLRLRDRFDPDPLIREFGLPTDYAVVTIHRAANVDTPEAAERVSRALVTAAELVPLIVPLHPRGRVSLAAAGLLDGPRLRVIEPLGYVDFLSLVTGARLVITDSGGIQEETTILDIPCLTLRPNTERPITITLGTNCLVTPETLVASVQLALRGRPQSTARQPPLWDGHAGARIAARIAG